MTPETPTPRTDAIAHRGLGSVAYIAEMTSLGRNLERELATKDAHADEIYQKAVELADMLEHKLEQERKLADEMAETLRDIEGRCSDTSIRLHPDADAKGCVDDCLDWSEAALSAWKEARK